MIYLQTVESFQGSRCLFESKGPKLGKGTPDKVSPRVHRAGVHMNGNKILCAPDRPGREGLAARLVLLHYIQMETKQKLKQWLPCICMYKEIVF